MRRYFLFTPLLLAGCNLIPPVARPDMPLPPGFKEGGIWKQATPSAHLDRGKWWAAFSDPVLDGLIQRVNVSNQSLVSSAAQAREVSALLASAKLAFFPSVEGDASYVRQRQTGSASTQRSIGLSSTWELDLWGKLRHQASATFADAQTAAADTESLKLSLQSQTAQTYFSLRATDAKLDLYHSELESYKKSLQLTQNRYNQGVASRSDVAQSQSQLASTEAEAIDLESQRAILEHALAVLTGLPPSSMSIGKTQLSSKVPSVPAATPSSLLQRRPDIASAERKVAAANQRIGAAKAAFYPTVTLDGSGGWRGSSGLLTAPNRYWSVGPSVTAPIFDRGALLAQKGQADATYEATVADYKQVVLTALQETEDALSTLRLLDRELKSEEDAVKAARDNERITMNQYQEGTVSYLNVVTAQATALTTERTAIDLRASRLNNTVALFKAIGGKW
jgi:NodT family efflux transporter outer membrane factor (OMF) lipoprotein